MFFDQRSAGHGSSSSMRPVSATPARGLGLPRANPSPVLRWCSAGAKQPARHCSATQCPKGAAPRGQAPADQVAQARAAQECCHVEVEIRGRMMIAEEQ